MTDKKISFGKLFNLISLVFVSWFVFTFLIFPLINIVLSTFMGDEETIIQNVRQLLESEIAMNGIKNSVILAFSLAITTNIIGIFIVLVTDYFDIKGAKVLKLGYMTTFIYSGVIVVSAYNLIYGANGVFTSLFTNINPEFNQDWFVGYGAVLFTMTFTTTTNHILFLGNSIKAIDNNTIEAAKNMGASQFTIIRRIILPIILPTILAITVLQFMTGLGAFSAPLILGGEDFQTISPLILMLSGISGSRTLAIMLSIVIGLMTVVLIFIFSKLERGGKYFSIAKTKAKYKKQKINNPIANGVVHIFAYLLFLVYLTPAVLVVVFSFTNYDAIYNASFSLSDFTLDNYRFVFSDLSRLEPFINSIVFAFISAVGVTLLVTVAMNITRKKENFITKVINNAFLIPWLFPATVIALSLIVSFDKPQILLFNQVLIGTSVILVLGYMIIRMPITQRLIKAAFMSINFEYEEAASALGSSDFNTFKRIVFPIILPTIIALVMLSFTTLLAEYDVSSFLAPARHQTLGIMIKNATSERASVDSQALIYVYTTIIMFISTLAMYLVYGVILNDKRKNKATKV